jgi:hypothetical protein
MWSGSPQRPARVRPCSRGIWPGGSPPGTTA